MAVTIPNRLPDWRHRFNAYLAATEGVPFRPGKHDCALFCAGGIKALTGFDPARGWRGYRTLAGGQKKLAKAGYANWWDMLENCEHTDPSKARVGDVVLAEGDGDFAGGLCLGLHIKVLGINGAALLPRSAIVRSFGI